MSTDLYRVVIPPEMLRRGFWLYVWIIRLQDGSCVYYVGRTGDTSSARAQSPLSRISGHLGPNKHANALQRHLQTRGINFDDCVELEFVAHGPLHEEANDWDAHKARRDKVHVLERDLYEGMKASGYDVLNVVACDSPTNEGEWKPIRAIFAKRFARLAPSAQ